MNSKLLIVTDLGHLRAFRVEDITGTSQHRVQAVDDIKTDVTHHLSTENTDQSGRYRKAPAVAGAMSDGQEHNVSLERRYRALKTLAHRVEGLIEREKPGHVYFAADARINEALLSILDRKTRAKISRSLSANLSNSPVPQILEQFGLGKSEIVTHENALKNKTPFDKQSLGSSLLDAQPAGTDKSGKSRSF